MDPGAFGSDAPLTALAASTCVLVALALWISAVKGDNVAQWLARCYWGKLGEKARYTNASQQQVDFDKLMAGT